jgi:hypothetical protein
MQPLGPTLLDVCLIIASFTNYEKVKAIFVVTTLEAKMKKSLGGVYLPAFSFRIVPQAFRLLLQPIGQRMSSSC